MKILYTADLTYLCEHHNRSSHKADVVESPVTFVVNYGSKLHESFNIPKGYRTDGYSIPAPFGFIVEKESVVPALLHDFMCEVANVNNSYSMRKKADKIFKAFLKQEGVSGFKTFIMYTAVRLYGYFHFKVK